MAGREILLQRGTLRPSAVYEIPTGLAEEQYYREDKGDVWREGEV